MIGCIFYAFKKSYITFNGDKKHVLEKRYELFSKFHHGRRSFAGNFERAHAMLSDMQWASIKECKSC